jgi:gliding motility-associated-like protein
LLNKLYIVFLLLVVGLNANAQKHDWAKNIRCFPTSTNNNVTPTALATDDSNNIYIGGAFRDSLFIENDTHFFQSNGTNRAIYLAKFKEDGSLIWSKSITSAQSANLKDIVINSSGSIILYGDYSTSSVSTSISFGSYSLTQSRGVFVAFMNSSGTFTSARDLVYAATWITANGIKLGPNDEIYSYNYLNGFGGGWTINSTSGAITGTGFVHVFCKHDSLGRRLRWQQNYTINQHIELGSIGVEPNGNLIYSFRAGTSQTIHGVSTGSATPVLLIRAASNNGNIQKIERIDVAGNAAIQSIEIPRSNEIYIQGFAKRDSIEIAGKVAKSPNQLGPIRPYYFNALLHDLDSSLWVQASTASPSIFVGNSRMIYSGGFLYSSFLVVADSFVMGGLRERRSSSTFGRIQTIIAKFDTLGNALWMLKTPSTGPPFIQPIGRSDVVYYGGFNNTVSLPPFTLSKPGRSTWPFLAKTFDFSIERGEVFSGPYCAGDSIRVPYTKTGVYDTANFFVAEISDENGDFNGGERELGRVKATEDSTIVGTLPLLKVPTSEKYRIRIRSTSPAVQSFFREDTLNLLIYSRDKADPGNDTSICIGDTLMLNTFGGTTWSWSPKINMDDSTSRTPLIWPDSATTYQIIIGDSSGCGAPDTASIRVALLPPPQIDSVYQSDTTACIGQDIVLKAYFKGGTQDYTAIWMDSSGSILRIGESSTKDSFGFVFVSDTTIQLILTDSCSEILDTVLFSVRLTPDEVEPFNLRDSTICYENSFGVAWVDDFSPNDSLSIVWKVGSDSISNQFSWSQVFTTSQTITYKLNNACTNREFEDTMNLTILARPEIAISRSVNKAAYCIGDSLRLFAEPNGGNGNHNYQWFIDGAIFSQDSSVQINFAKLAQINTAVNDSIQVNIVYTDSCSGIVATDSIVLRTLPSLNVDSWNITDSVFCKGDSVELTGMVTGGTGNYNYNWSLNNTSLSSDSLYLFVPSTLASGVATLKLSATDNCSFADSLETQIVILDSLSTSLIGFEDSVSVCIGEELTFLTNTNGGRATNYAYNWYIDESLVASNNSYSSTFTKPNPFQNQTYKVKLEVSDNCSQYAPLDSVIVVVSNQAVLSLEADSLASNQQFDTTLCYGEEYLIRPSIYNVTSDEQSISWILNGSTVSTEEEFTFGSAYYLVGESNFNLQAVLYDSCSTLSDTLSITINVLDSLSLKKLTDTSVCFGSSLNRLGVGSGGKQAEYSWLWTDIQNGNALSTSDTLSLSNLENTQQVRLSLSDGCSFNTPNEVFQINVLEPLRVNLIEAESCFKDSTQIVVTGTGGITSDYSFQWWLNGSFLADNDNQISVIGDDLFEYQVVLLDGCSTPSDTFKGSVATAPLIALDLPIDSVCEIYSHSLNPQDTSQLNSSFQLFENGNPTSNASNLSLAAGSYQYQLVATNVEGCIDSVSFDVFVKPLPSAAFSFSPNEPTDENPVVQFNALNIADSFSWSIDGLRFANAQNATYTFSDTGMFTIQLRVHQDGCTADSSIRIPFTRTFEYLGVNAFSPNGDGLNDTYKPYFFGAKDFSYKIFNRWGGLVFMGESKDDSWDGTYQNAIVPAGKYLVLIKAKDASDKAFFTREVILVTR